VGWSPDTPPNLHADFACGPIALGRGIRYAGFAATLTPSRASVLGSDPNQSEIKDSEVGRHSSLLFVHEHLLFFWEG